MNRNKVPKRLNREVVSIHESADVSDSTVEDGLKASRAQALTGEESIDLSYKRPARKRRGISVKQYLEADSDDESDPAYRPLETEAKHQQPPRKRRKGTLGLDLDALGLVMEYVGHRELLVLVSSCKALQSKLTMEMVVKSAMVTGNKVSNRILNFVGNELSLGAVYLPSPFRLLRLTNAKRCEFCYERTTDASNIYQRGLMCCFTCKDARLTTESVVVPRSQPRIMSLLKSSRLQFDMVLGCGASAGAVLRFFRSTLVSGEAVGPILTLELFRTMVDRVKEFPEQSIKYIVDEVLVHNPAREEGCARFKEAREATWQLAEEAAEILRTERRQTALKAARNRLANLEPVLDKLKPKLRANIRRFALEYDVDEKHAVTFRCPLVGKLLKYFVRAPTKVTNKELNAVATKLNEKFKVLVESELLSTGFLSADDPFEARLKSIYLDSFPDLASVAPNLTDKVLGLIHDDDLFGAMLLLADFSFEKVDFGSKLLSGLSTQDVPNGRASSLKFCGAHWLRCFRHCGSNPRLAFTMASGSLVRMANMLDAFFMWAESTADDSTAEFISYYQDAVYTGPYFHMIAAGLFESLLRYLRRGFSYHNARHAEEHDAVDAAAGEIVDDDDGNDSDIEIIDPSDNE